MKLLLSALVFLVFHATSAFALDTVSFRALPSLSNPNSNTLHISLAAEAAYSLGRVQGTRCDGNQCTINMMAVPLNGGGHVGQSVDDPNVSSTMSGNIGYDLTLLREQGVDLESADFTVQIYNYHRDGKLDFGVKRTVEFKLSDIPKELRSLVLGR